MGKTIIIAAGVFAVLFAVVLFVPVDHLFASSAKAPQSRQQDLSADGQLTSTVDATFSRVQAQVKAKGPMTPEQEAAYNDAEDLQKNTIYAKITGKTPPTPAEMQAARNDAPSAVGYSRYALLDRFEMDIPGSAFSDNQELRDLSHMKVACFSRHDTDRTTHVIVLYDGSHFEPLEGVDTVSWMYGGCAAAMVHGRDLNKTQVVTTMRDLMPATPEFAQKRQELMASLNAKPQHP